MLPVALDTVQMCDGIQAQFPYNIAGTQDQD